MKDTFEFKTFASFYPKAQLLRSEFEVKFENDRSTRVDRFQWDPWFVKDQYQLLRTPAQSFFTPKVLDPFLKNLVIFGRENFGCENISTPWLSLYTEGSFQGLHADVPHGPFAFVYSLTPSIRFEGGETLLLKPEILSYWNQKETHQLFEEKQIFEKIPSPFDCLTVFDPRIPHGVSRVSGVNNPLQGRLVIHGWFVNPGPQIVGKIDPQKAEALLSQVVPMFLELNSSKVSNVRGMLILEVTLKTSGPLSISIVVNTLKTPLGEGVLNRQLLASKDKILEEIKVSKVRGSGRLIVPIVFES